MTTDDVDRRIIAILNGDGRINNKDIAGKLGVSEGTVRNRIRKLMSNNLLKVSGLIDPDDSPVMELFLLGITIESSKDMVKVAKKISMLEEVLATHHIAGRYDIMAELWVEAKGGLIKFLSQTLTKVEGIAATESFMVMKSYNKWIPRNEV